MTVERDPEQTETQILHNLLNFAKRHILEIGCGNGRLTWRYAPTAGSVAGIDLDHDQLLDAKQACQPFLKTKAVSPLLEVNSITGLSGVDFHYYFFLIW